jgi:hypothetical protein
MKLSFKLGIQLSSETRLAMRAQTAVVGCDREFNISTCTTQMLNVLSNVPAITNAQA